MPRPARTREQSGWRRARKTQASGVGRQAPGRKKWTVHSGRERSIERRAARGKQRAPDGARRRSAARHSGRAHASRLRCSMCAEAWARLHVSAGMRPAAGGKRGGQATGQAEGRAGRLSLRLPPCCTLPARQQLSVKSQARVSALRACASQRMTAGRRRVGRAGRGGGGGGAHRDSARASRLTGCAPVGSRSRVNRITRCPLVAGRRPVGVPRRRSPWWPLPRARRAWYLLEERSGGFEELFIEGGIFDVETDSCRDGRGRGLPQ